MEELVLLLPPEGEAGIKGYTANLKTRGEEKRRWLIELGKGGAEKLFKDIPA